MSLFENVKMLRSEVVKEDLQTFKNCGRNKCLELLQAVFLLDEKVGYHLDCKNDGFYGNEKGFLRIENINSLIEYCNTKEMF